MKLLYILGNIINRAGVERIMTQKINYLAETDCDISLMTTDQMHLPFSFPISKKVHYIPVNAPIPSRTDYPFYKWLFLFYKARSVYMKTLNHVIKGNQPDMIICTTYSFDVLDLLTKLCHKNNIKLVIESHIQLTNVFMKQRLAYHPILSLYGKLHDSYILHHIKKAAMLVCLTNEDMKSWKQLHIENLFVIPNMITIRPPKTIDYSIKRVIAVGRYSDQKGFDMLIKAWGKLSLKYNDWHLYIFGNEDRAPYEEMAKTEKCQDTCHCMPVTDDIASEYGKSSIFVMSSRYEGMPLALIEAMSSGLACVSFNCPNGPSDIINDGIDGLLAKNGDIDDLTTKMERLICNDSLRKEFGITARHNIERYSPDAIMQQNRTLYKRILSQA
jgi:glycosyltransferase involved in cell wall biosynthesis